MDEVHAVASFAYLPLYHRYFGAISNYNAYGINRILRHMLRFLICVSCGAIVAAFPGPAYLVVCTFFVISCTLSILLSTELIYASD